MAQWMARWGLLAAGVVAAAVAVAAELRKARDDTREAADDEIAAAPVEA
jgi:hypothetical protein